jgi:hypothetical protein
MKKKKQTLSTVISCDPYSKTYYTGTPTNIEKAKKQKFLKTQYAISSLSTKLCLSASIEISKNIDEEDYGDVLENKAYEELGLDIATEYKIGFYEVEELQDDTNRTFNVFVVDPMDFKEIFAPIVEQIRYIDQIYPVSLLIRSLYKKEIIRDDGIDCFIYFSEDDAFLTLYRDAEFLYTKELKFTLAEIHELFCEIYGERVSYENFITLFIEDGLRTTNEDNKEFLIKLLNEMFSQINDVINFAKRSFELKSINKLYIGTSAGVVFGMDEFAQTTLGVQALNFDFEYGFEANEFYVDQIQQLLHLTAQLVSDERYDINFTIFDRPPPYIQRESGRLITLAAGTILIASLYPIWNVSYTAFTQIESTSLTAQKNAQHKLRVERERQVKIQNDLKSNRTRKLTTETKLLNRQQNVLIQIHAKKVKYPMKANIISQLTKDLNKYNVYLNELTYIEENSNNSRYFSLQMVSDREKRMTDMIEKLTKENLANYKVTLEKISYKDEEKSYISDLKVSLR